MTNFINPSNVAAFDIFGQPDTNNTPAVDCSNGSPASTSAVCTQQRKDNSQNPLTGPNGALAAITNIVALVAGAAAIIILIIGSIRYITSAGDSSKISSAKNTIVYALVGIAVIVLARTLITYVVSKL